MAVFYNAWKYLRSPYSPADIGSRWRRATAYVLDTPRTEKQFQYQARLNVLTFGALGRYHASKEEMAYQKSYMSLYGKSFSDMKYPWLSGYGQAMSGMAQATLGTSMQVSRNAMNLYTRLSKKRRK